MKIKRKIKIVDDEKFIRDNFERLVRKYGGTTIVVANREIFTEKNAIDKIRKKYPKICPFILSLPRPEFFTGHFLL